MGVTPADKTNVQTTWAATYKEWDAKNGEAFYKRMFANQPTIEAKFTKPDLKLQSGKFGVMVQRWMNGLDNEAELDSAMQEFTKRHIQLKITDMATFGVALTELKQFVDSTVSMNEDQKKSWGVVAEAILASMKKHFGQ